MLPDAPWNRVPEEQDRKAEEFINVAHPFAVTLCKVIVNGDDMYAVARKRVEVCGEGSHKGLTFTRLHFRDSALMQNDTADKLNVIMTLAEHAPRCFSYRRKRFGKDIVERFAVCQSALKYFGLTLKGSVVHCGVFIGKRFYLSRYRFDLFQLFFAVCAEKFFK